MAGGPVILIDGVPQKIGDYRYDNFSFIPISQIERIEVLRSAGIAYGPGSSRGVINIITKKGSKEKPFNFEAEASYGSWDTHNEYVGLHGRDDLIDYFVNAANYSTNGYEQEEQDRKSALIKLGYNFSENTRIGIRGNFTKNDMMTAYGLAKNKWHLDNYRRDIHFPESKDDLTKLIWHNEKEQQVSTLGLEFSQKDTKLSINSNFSWTKYDEIYKDMHEKFTSDDTDRVENNDKDQDTYTFNFSSSYNFDFGKIHYTPSIGVNFESINFEQKISYPYEPGTYELLDIDEKQYGLFWDNDFLFGEKLGLKLGARVDKAELEFDDRTTTVDEDDSMFSWVVAPSYHFTKNANLYASVARNFWFPTPRYYAWAAQYSARYNSDVNLPEDLKPEESLTYEIGYKHIFNKALNINLTAFFTDYKDKFATFYNYDEVNDKYNYMGQKNLGEAEMKGLEFEADGRPFSFLGYRLSGTYLDAEWTKGNYKIKNELQNLDGYNIYGIPEYTYVIGLDIYPIQNLKCSVDINGYGSYYLDYFNTVEYESKNTVDANISFKFKNWKFWILGKNILDEDIERAFNSKGTIKNGEPDNYYYVQDGRYIEFGISYKF
ncbi:iron complex outermembrane recepter protein [Candidatus Magnetomoraceae bacterium gMMP-1]